ncbi:MAG: sigma-54 dependent transcriptional regulator [Nitrospirae bacterium]|nr:sigma-54 dependent transcriptional regulator [Nitrospirota bacterium]
MRPSLLVVDDMPDMVRFLGRILREELGVAIHAAGSGEEALQLLREGSVGVVLADMRMPRMDGMELLRRIREMDDSVVVVMMTAYGSIADAVESLKLGAYDYITKPFDEERLIHTTRKALDHSSLIRENRALEKRIREKETFEHFVGASPAIKNLVETIQLVAKTDVTVLITGETGTGKDLTAKMIHALSSRAGRPFVAVNCPAIPETILESELFGYKKGAFTGANQDREGLFQSAEEGTIVLDEIGDISLVLQAKLLRVLQEKEIKPLGDTRTYTVDVRIIASTNQDLAGKISAGRFREDLYYRLNVVSLRTPSLKEIPEDIPLIANHFLSLYCSEFGMPRKGFSEEALRALASRQWSGNVRELQNEIKRAVIFSRGDTISADAFGGGSLRPTRPEGTLAASGGVGYKEARKNLLAQFSIHYVAHLLKDSEGNISLAAKKAGLERQSLQHLMRKYGINANEFRKSANKQ